MAPNQTRVYMAKSLRHLSRGLTSAAGGMCTPRDLLSPRAHVLLPESQFRVPPSRT